MKPLRGVAAAVKGNVAGFKGLPVVIRSRKQAAMAQRERNRRMYEFARSSPASEQTREGSIRMKITKTQQGNLLTGGADTVKKRSQPRIGPSRIGSSAAARKNEARADRLGARTKAVAGEYRSLLESRSPLKAGRMAKTVNRMAKLEAAAAVYRMGTGRKPARRSTGRR